MKERKMAKREKDKKRERPIILQSRMSEDEAALVRDQASRAGVSVSALIRYALLNQTPLRASRQTPANRKETSRLIGTLGALTQALKDAAIAGEQAQLSDQIEAAHRDIADMCFACFKALGRDR